MSRLSLCLLTCGVVGAAIAAPLLAGCGDCAMPLPGPVVLLQTTGFVVVAADSSCGNVSVGFDGTQVIATPPPLKMTCHVDVTLDDGEMLAFDVPFTKDVQTCCGNRCSTSVGTDWATLTISAPPGYVPQVDGGADASSDAPLDAPEEPPLDASID